jgi:hypothetical protein
VSSCSIFAVFPYTKGSGEMASCCVLEKNGNWYGQRMRRERKSCPCCHGPGPPICRASCLFLWGRMCALMFLYCAGSHITVFGSFVMDLYTGSSDLDLSLNVGYAPVERSRSDRIGFLRKLTRALHGLQNGPYSAPSNCFTAS